MASYVILGKYTEQGIRNIKQSPQRTDAVRSAFEAAGGKLSAFYLTLGHYDFVAIAEAPDDQTFAKVVLGVAAGGNVTTETLKGIPEAEYRTVIASMP